MKVGLLQFFGWRDRSVALEDVYERALARIAIMEDTGYDAVWLAEHQMLARPAAIKLIRPESLGADAAGSRVVEERFKREARATAALRSSHTISLYDFGVTDDGSFYYVMELLEGLDLATLVNRFGPLPAARDRLAAAVASRAPR